VPADAQSASKSAGFASLSQFARAGVECIGRNAGCAIAVYYRRVISDRNACMHSNIRIQSDSGGWRSSALLRLLAAAVFVGLWISLGAYLSLQPNAYLLLGAPLTILFQRYVVGRPLIALWIFRSSRWHVSPKTWLIAPGLAVMPLYLLYTMLSQRYDALRLGWAVSALVGAAVAAVTIAARRGRISRAGLQLTIYAVAAGCSVIALAGWQQHAGVVPSITKVPSLIRDFLLYFSVCFVLEEVTFRGSIDQFLIGAASGSALSWTTAIATSALWGLWHLPIAFGPTNPASLYASFQIVAFHTGVGCLLSMAARSAGDLVPAAIAHALIDAYRNCVLG
jgi:Type II CAAX prenyl endopeptidase Rce1-like